MERRLIRKVLKIEGMTCTGCELRIEKALRKLDGVVEARAMFGNSQTYVTYDARVIGLEQIVEAIEKLDCKVSDGIGEPLGAKTPEARMPVSRLLVIAILVLALYTMLNNTVGIDFLSEIDASMSYGVLFVVGLLTSLHCIAMCGGINLSQCVSYRDGNGNTGRFSNLRPGLLYNGGRVISYTVIGGIAGALGSGISFSGAARGIVAVTAGVFMVIMGLNMLNAFPWLRKLNPRMPGILRSKIQNGKGRGAFLCRSAKRPDALRSAPGHADLCPGNRELRGRSIVHVHVQHGDGSPGAWIRSGKHNTEFEIYPQDDESGRCAGDRPWGGHGRQGPGIVRLYGSIPVPRFGKRCPEQQCGGCAGWLPNSDHKAVSRYV